MVNQITSLCEGAYQSSLEHRLERSAFSVTTHPKGSYRYQPYRLDNISMIVCYEYSQLLIESVRGQKSPLANSVARGLSYSCPFMFNPLRVVSIVYSSPDIFLPFLFAYLVNIAEQS